MMVSIRPGDFKDRDDVIHELINIQYMRNDMELGRCNFRVRGDTIEIFPANADDYLIRVEFFGDEIDKISEIDIITGVVLNNKKSVSIFPASHFVTSEDKLEKAIENIKIELDERIKYFKDNNKPLEAERIEGRTNYDLEMLSETGFCRGVENYSRHLSGKREG